MLVPSYVCFFLFYCFFIVYWKMVELEEVGKAQMSLMAFSLFKFSVQTTFCTLDDYHPKMYWIFPTLHAKEQWRPQCLAKECDSVLGIFICLRFVPLRNPYFFSYQVSLFQEDYKQLAQHDSLWSFIACAPKKYEGSPVLEYSNMFSYCSVAYR